MEKIFTHVEKFFTLLHIRSGSVSNVLYKDIRKFNKLDSYPESMNYLARLLLIYSWLIPNISPLLYVGNSLLEAQALLLPRLGRSMKDLSGGVDLE